MTPVKTNLTKHMLSYYTFNHKATCIFFKCLYWKRDTKKNHLVTNTPSGLTFMHAHSHTAALIWGRFKWPHPSQHKSCLQSVRTMINDRNIRPRWSNVNHHPHSAKGAGNPYMATLWQWRMLSPSGRLLRINKPSLLPLRIIIPINTAGWHLNGI